MTIETRIHRFEPSGLDPITVYVEQYEPRASRIVVRCYAQAWTAYWGGHGDQPVEDFICECNTDYLAENLTWGMNSLYLKAQEKREFEYVKRIAASMQAHFNKIKNQAQEGEAA